MADEDHHRLADRMTAVQVTHAAIRRVPRVGEPQYVGLADQPGLPWLCPYLEDADSTRLDVPVFGPFVPVSMVGPAGPSPIYGGLIDTGSDAILASDLVADYVGLDVEDHDGERQPMPALSRC